MLNQSYIFLILCYNLIMPYDVLEKQIKSLPQEYYIQVENFVLFMLQEAKRNSKKIKEKEISKRLADVYSKLPEDEQLATCNATLDSWRELTKNDSW